MNDAAARAEMARAVHARRNGDLAGAAAIASAVLARRPDDAGALNLLGLLAQSAGRLDEAVARLRRATAADPGAAPLWLNLAAAFRLKNDFEAEIVALDRSLVLDPALLPALLGKAAALERLGRTAASARAWAREESRHHCSWTSGRTRRVPVVAVSTRSANQNLATRL